MFMADEFANGKNLMTGEYVLPSGACGERRGALARGSAAHGGVPCRAVWRSAQGSPERCPVAVCAGTTMNFGVMIGKLKRDKLMKDVLQVGLKAEQA